MLAGLGDRCVRCSLCQVCRWVSMQNLRDEMLLSVHHCRLSEVNHDPSDLSYKTILDITGPSGDHQVDQPNLKPLALSSHFWLRFWLISGDCCRGGSGGAQMRSLVDLQCFGHSKNWHKLNNIANKYRNKYRNRIETEYRTYRTLKSSFCMRVAGTLIFTQFRMITYKSYSWSQGDVGLDSCLWTFGTNHWSWSECSRGPDALLPRSSFGFCSFCSFRGFSKADCDYATIHVASGLLPVCFLVTFWARQEKASQRFREVWGAEKAELRRFKVRHGLWAGEADGLGHVDVLTCWRFDVLTSSVFAISFSGLKWILHAAPERCTWHVADSLWVQNYTTGLKWFQAFSRMEASWSVWFGQSHKMVAVWNPASSQP